MRSSTVWALLAGSLPLGGAALSLAQEPTDQMQVSTTGQMAEFTWSDTEDTLRGHWNPAAPRAGQPLRVAIRVGTFEGKPFAGPVTITLRPAAEGHGETVTVQPSPGWSADFHPEEAGTYQLDVSFRTTHFKVAHARVEVGPSHIPSYIAWALLAALALIAVTAGVLRVLRPPRDRPAKDVA